MPLSRYEETHLGDVGLDKPGHELCSFANKNGEQT